MNEDRQLALLRSFHFSDELHQLAQAPPKNSRFYFGNEFFGSGDAEFYYSLIRKIRPRRIIEIGSGYSTLVALSAIDKNRQEDGAYRCELVCVEPFENPWLELTGARIVRQRVETLDPAFFTLLRENDILFIDSSHMIRPQGDVLVEYLEILPRLNPGVFIHIHDIFTPRDYLDDWLEADVRFWNEQYLLEAFLAFNGEFKVVGALNFLKHRFPQELSARFPILGEQMDSREPGSFWMQRTL